MYVLIHFISNVRFFISLLGYISWFIYYISTLVRMESTRWCCQLGWAVRLEKMTVVGVLDNDGFRGIVGSKSCLKYTRMRIEVRKWRQKKKKKWESEDESSQEICSQGSGWNRLGAKGILTPWEGCYKGRKHGIFKCWCKWPCEIKIWLHNM